MIWTNYLKMYIQKEISTKSNEAAEVFGNFGGILSEHSTFSNWAPSQINKLKTTIMCTEI